MSPDLVDPTGPGEWFRRARSDLTLAKSGRTSDDVLYQDLCFHATRYAVQDRYPGLAGDATAEDYDRAIRLAERVMRWTEATVAAADSERGS